MSHHPGRNATTCRWLRNMMAAAVVLLLIGPLHADEAMLAEAERLINAGDARAAAELLAPLEPTYAGDVRFDYLLGLALLETGEAAAAAAALGRVVAADPLFAGARMDYAQALYVSGRYVEAREQFDMLLEQGPPPVARRAIEEYIAAVDMRLAARQTRIDGMLRPVLGYDSNANAATAANDFLGFTLDEQSQEAGSAFVELNGALNMIKPMRSGLRAVARFDIQGRHYPDASFVDFIGGNARFGLAWLRAGESRGVALRAYRLHVDGDFNNQGLSLEGTWDRAFGDLTRAGIFLRAGVVRYEDELDIKDVDQLLGGVSVSRRFGSQRSVLATVAGILGRDEATDSESRYSRNLIGIRGNASWRLTQRLLARVGAGYQRFTYDEPFFESQFDDDRDDDLWEAETGLQWALGTGWQLDAGVRYADNDSNVDLYSYDRWVSYVGLSKFWR